MTGAVFTVTIPASLEPEAATGVVELLRERMQALHIELQRRIVEEKLSGQVLHERTGTLRRSIQEETVQEGDLIRSSVFTNLVYAAIHEFGGVITPKTASALVFEIDGKMIFAKMVKMPKRPYMVPTFTEMRQEIVGGLEAALQEGVA